MNFQRMRSKLYLCWLILLGEAPVVGAALDGHRALLLHLVQGVGAAHHGELPVDLVEILALPGMLGEGRQAGRLPEVDPMLLLGGDADGEAVHDHRAREAVQAHPEQGGQVLGVHDDVVVELHVPGGDGLAVAPLAQGLSLKVKVMPSWEVVQDSARMPTGRFSVGCRPARPSNMRPNSSLVKKL